MKSTTHKRPWGSFIEFTKNEPTTVKILVVHPDEQLSLQYHKNRREFWRILSGAPTLIIGDNELDAKVGDEFVVEVGDLHRITAHDTEVQVLEISYGEFDEDDIVRVEDKYKRVT